MHMIIRKNISLNEEYLKKLEPLLQKHNGNLSSVMREVIDLADAAFQDPDSVKRLISGLKKEQNLTSWTLFWSLKNLTGRLPDEEFVQNIIEDYISSISSLEKRLNELGGEIYWGSSVKISSDDDRLPKNVTFTITGKNPDMNRFLGAVAALFAAKKHNLGVSKVRSISNPFEMEMIRGENEWALKSVAENFGNMDIAFSELYRNPDFWNTTISLYEKMDYDMVAISRQFFDEILAGKTSPKTTTAIERFFGCHINQITLEDLIKKMKVLYPSMGIIEKIDTDKDSLIIHHGLTEPLAIKKIAAMFIELLKLNGQTYSSEVNENLIVLKRLPEVGRILIKLMEDLKLKEISLADYHKHLPKMLDVLKDMPFDEKLITSLGCRLGEIMIQKYGKDNAVEKWDAGTFVRYVQEMNAILKQDSKWDIISENVIQGKIFNCNMAKGDDKFDIADCTFIRGIIEGSILHAFGEQSERIHKRYSGASAENDFCEIYVAF